MLRNLFLYIISFSLLACSAKESDVVVLRPHQELPDSVENNRSYVKVFLAGTIDMGNSVDWQKEIVDNFKAMDGRFILFNPRQEKWDPTREGEMDYQVRWELSHLEDADHIIMNILPTSKSPICLLEMGVHIKSKKLYVICSEPYYRYDNIRITCEYYNVPLYSSLAEMFAEVKF